MAAITVDTSIYVRKQNDTRRLLEHVKDGEMSLAELSAVHLDQQEIALFLARELHFLGRVATTAKIPYLHDLLEELHVALLRKVNR